MIGRWQPLHKGHCALIRKVLNEGKNVLVALRLTGVNKKNPYTYDERVDMFWKEFTPELKNGKLRVIPIPDIEEVIYGRKVGWGVREIRLDENIESISATEIRKKNENKKSKS
jgi:cytidyltransferase-like protein